MFSCVYETVLICVVQEMEDTVVSPEKAEEAKLKARYPHLRTKPGGSDLLRKRLQKGVGFCFSWVFLFILEVFLRIQAMTCRVGCK